ncbi:MAG: hypothetical protein ACFFF4_08935 [Candidatus Thorarchaeota archaeon]
MTSGDEKVIDDSIQNVPFDPLKVIIIQIFLVVLTYILIPNDRFLLYHPRGILFLPISSTSGLSLMLIPVIVGFVIYFAIDWTVDEFMESLWVACSFVFMSFPVIPLWQYYGWGESPYLEEMFVYGWNSTWWPVIQGMGLAILIIAKRESEYAGQRTEMRSMKTDVFALSFGGAILSGYSIVQIARPDGIHFRPTPFTFMALVTGMIVCILTVIIPITRWSISYWNKRSRFRSRRDLSTSGIENNSCTMESLSVYDH